MRALLGRLALAAFAEEADARELRHSARGTPAFTVCTRLEREINAPQPH